MPKRKRADDDDRPDSNIGAKQQRVQVKLKGNVAKLRHAFKIAKGLERQKLSKRSKGVAAGKSDKSLDRIDAEVSALKVRVQPFSPLTALV